MLLFIKAHQFFVQKAVIGILILVVLSIAGVSFSFAAPGVNRTINFQGKVVNKTAGTNVTNGNYDFTFRLYDAASNGNLLWTENWTTAGGGQIAVTDGIFRVTLGSHTTFASENVDFNSDSLYLDITFNGETMGSRVRFTAVPYALNAEKVSGLTVTNNGGNTLNIAANKTFTVNNSITFSGTDTTTFTLPTGNDTIAGLAASQIFTNKTIGSTGLVFSGATTDITTGANEALTITPNANGNVLINPNAGGQAALVVDKLGANDIFTASSSGVTRFVIDNNGSVGIGISQPTAVLHVTKSTLTSGPLALLDATQTAVSGSDTSDMGLNVSHMLTANSGSSELVQRGIMATLTNNLTGGGAISNMRGLTIKANTNAGTVTTALDNIYIENGTTNGTVQDSRGLMINGLQGANRAGVVINSLTGTNNTYLVLGSGNIPTGNFGIHNSSSYNNYIAGNVGIGTSSPIAKLHVTGAPYEGGNALAIFNQTNADDILTASASGTTKFRLANTGRVFLDSSYYNASCTALETDSNGQVLCGTDDGGVGGTNYWQLNDGALTPFSITTDLNLGATATASAKISLAGSLTRGKALAIFNQTEDQDILTASASGVTKFTLDKSGNIFVGDGSLATPAYSFLSETGLGFYRSATNTLSLASNGTQVLSASDVQISSNVPHQFTAAGDVVVAYDLLFNNQTASYIKSNAGLTLEAGEVFESNTITLKTYNSGNILFDTTTSAGVQVGTDEQIGKLQVSGAKTGKALVVLNESGDQNILVASSSGSQVFSVGRIPAAGTSGDFLSVNPSLTNMNGSDTVRGLYVNFTNGTHSSTGNVINAIDVGNISGSSNATETALNIGTGWDTGIAIASGGITISAGGMTISGGSFTYSGSARPTKTMTFSPEYAGGIITASGSATTTGSMTSDNAPTANFRTYYEWSASDGSNLQDYTVAVRIKLPKDFSAWATSNAITIDYNTEVNTAADNKFDVYIYQPTDSSSNPVYFKTANVAATGNVWTTLTIDDGEIDNNDSADWDQADETAIIYLKMYSRGDNFTQIGDITLNYLAAF